MQARAAVVWNDSDAVVIGEMVVHHGVGEIAGRGMRWRRERGSRQRRIEVAARGGGGICGSTFLCIIALTR